MMDNCIARTLRKYRKFLIFGTIGAANTVVHAGGVILLVELFHANPTVANFCAFMVANVSSYVLNSLITFKASLHVYRYVKFFFSSLFTLGMTLTISQIGQFFNVHYLYSLAAIIVLTPVVSFLILNKFVFNKPAPIRSEAE